MTFDGLQDLDYEDPCLNASLNWSLCNYTDDYHEDLKVHLLEGVGTCIMLSLMSLILLIGLLGNGLVIYVVLRHGAMKTVTNLFLVNLALCDVLFLLICLPFHMYRYVSQKWIFGAFTCKQQLVDLY